MKEDEVPREILTEIVHKSCGAFRSEEVTPLVKVDGHYVLVSNYIIVGEEEEVCARRLAQGS